MDIAYLLRLQNLREALPPFCGGFMMVVSDIVLLLRYIIPMTLFWCISKEAGAFVSLASGIGSAFNQLLKNTFCVYRPWVRSAEIQPYGNSKATATGYSFPSGHTIAASSVYGSTACLYRKKRVLSASLVALALLTGFSRNFLGCHTPQDVIVALLEGIISIFAVHLIAVWFAKTDDCTTRGNHASTTCNPRDKWILLFGCVFVAFMLLYIELKAYPLDYSDGALLVDPEKMKLDCYGDGGYLAGILVGWFLERRLVRYRIAGSPAQKAVRVIWGIAICALIFAGGTKALSAVNPKARMFAVQFAMEIFILFLGPLIIKAHSRPAS